MSDKLKAMLVGILRDITIGIVSGVISGMIVWEITN